MISASILIESNCVIVLKLCGQFFNFKQNFETLTFNDTQEKFSNSVQFTQFSTRMVDWLLLTFFICLHVATKPCDYGLNNQLSSINSIITY